MTQPNEFILVVVDAPTQNEYQTGNLCWGAARRIVENTLKSLGNKLPLRFVPAVPVPLENTRTSPSASVWKPYVKDLQDKIREEKPCKVLALGAVAMSTLCAASRTLPITKTHGRAVNICGVYTVCAYNPYAVLKDPDIFRDFVTDVAKLVDHDSLFTNLSSTTRGIQRVVVSDVSQLIRCLNYLNRQEYVACDLETTGLNPHSCDIISVGLGLPSGYCVIVPRELVWSEGEVRTTLYRFFNQPIDKGPLFVFHNAKFDLKFLIKYLGRVTDKIADTLLMHYAMDERPIGRYNAHGLKDLSRIRYDAQDYKWDFDKFYATPDEERPYDEFYTYQCFDLWYTALLYQDLKPEMEEESTDLYNKLCLKILFPATHSFAKAEMFGVKLDQLYLEGLIEEYDKKIDYVRSEIAELTRDPHFNPLSPAQVADWIWSKFEYDLPKSDKSYNHDFQSEDNTEGLSTRKDELMHLADKFNNEPEAVVLRKIVDIRRLTKLQQTYFRGLYERMDSDGRIRTDIRLAGTATGRLSSANPNLQNIPARIGALVRDAFIADPGHTLIQYDYSQLELRMLAYLSRDEKMAQTFREGTDIHKAVAASIFKKPVEEVTKLERFLAKSIDFGVVYGRGAYTLVDGVEMDYYEAQGGIRLTVFEAQKFIDEFLNGYPAMYEWMQEQQRLVMRYQYVETIFGRRRRFPFIPQDKRIISGIKRQAVNTPIQSAASDLCLLALSKLTNELPEQVQVLFSVHDSILFQCPDDMVNDVLPQIKHTMERGIITDNFVPFSVEGEIGQRWGSLTKIGD